MFNETKKTSSAIISNTVCPGSLQVAVVGTAREALAFATQGFCPIECAFGEESIVDSLRLDHHGKMSYDDPVSLHAWRHHQNKRTQDPRFVVVGVPDADGTFAISVVGGLLAEAKNQTYDPGSMAAIIAAHDLDPIGSANDKSSERRILELFQCLKLPVPDSAAWISAINFWRWAQRTAAVAAMGDAVRAIQAQRATLVGKCSVARVSPEVALVQSSTWGFDIWYRKIAPVILRYDGASGRATLGCRNQQTAERLLGCAGLLSVFSVLEPSGWGGRPTVGGSPRNARLTYSEVMAAAETVAEVISKQACDAAHDRTAN